MKALYVGRCGTCDQKISVGAEIEPAMFVSGVSVWAHVTCPPEIPHGPVCPGCHLEKALDGSCDCPDQDRKPLGLRALLYQERT